MRILPFQLKQVKNDEKSEKSKKAILTHSSGPQSDLKQLFMLTQSQKSLSVNTVRAYANKDQMARI
jgi:hypothetical protein